MVRADLVQKLITEHPDLPARAVENIVTTFFGEITSRLAAGGRVELRGFGAFTTRARDARIGRNPRTGEPVRVKAKRVPYFKAGKELRLRIDVSAT